MSVRGALLIPVYFILWQIWPRLPAEHVWKKKYGPRIMPYRDFLTCHTAWLPLAVGIGLTEAVVVLLYAFSKSLADML